MKDALLRAQSLQKRGRFRLALEILESNVNKDALSTLTLEEQVQTFDLLASLCEKQGLTQNARRYATHIIRKNDRDIRGYLRLGKILQLIPDKLVEAENVYQRALQRVKPMTEKYRDFLNKQLANIRARVKALSLPDKRAVRLVGKDFVEVLPTELCRMIFGELSLKERVRCSLVCRKWQSYLYSDPIFWTDLIFTAPSAQSKSKHAIVSPETLLKYCERSREGSRMLKIDMQSVLIKDPTRLLKGLATSHASRLHSFKVNPFDPVADKPLLRKLRADGAIGGTMPRLSELRINSDSPTGDIQWCLRSLPGLTSLDVVICPGSNGTVHISSRDSIQEFPVCANLRVISVLGITGNQYMSEMFVSQLVGIPSLTSIDIHRVIPHYWPSLSSALANPKLKRLGFTSGSIYGRDSISPLPKFRGQIEQLTLNDTTISYLQPLLLPDGTRWTGYLLGSEPTKNLKYIELKRTALHDYSLPELLHVWGCMDTLEVLVVHSLSYKDTIIDNIHNSIDDVFPHMEVLQFTGMGTVSAQRLAWILASFPQLKKFNLDGTVITGPQLVQILTNLKELRAIRCNSVIDIGADTIRWAKNLRDITVIF